MTVNRLHPCNLHSQLTELSHTLVVDMWVNIQDNKGAEFVMFVTIQTSVMP